VIIDGDHGYDAVCNDSALADSIVKLGGMIVWHDYREGWLESVWRALNERYAAGHRGMRHIGETLLAYERV
jgi:hypothetical protein